MTEDKKRETKIPEGFTPGFFSSEPETGWGQAARILKNALADDKKLPITDKTLNETIILSGTDKKPNSGLPPVQQAKPDPNMMKPGAGVLRGKNSPR